MVEALLHRLITPVLFVAFVLAGCGDNYDPPENLYSPARSNDDSGSGQAVDFEGQWQVVSLSQDSVPIDLEDSGLDVVLDIAADGTARWHVREDGEHYFFCSADDMVLAQDQLVKDQVFLNYYHVVVDSETLQVTENEGLKQTQYTAVQSDDGLIDLQDGHPPRGIVMLPELNLFNPSDIVSLTLQAVTVDLSGSAPTQQYALECSIKSDIVDSINSLDDEPPVITFFALTSATPTTDSTIAFDLEGRDNVAVRAWLINESAAVPALDDAAWSGTTPSAYTLSDGSGTKTVYAWAKDAGGNISDPASISVDYSLPPCQGTETPASPEQFEIDNVSNSTGDLSSFSADDDDFLEMEIDSTQVPMVLTVDFELADTDVSDLRVRVSSISRQSSQNQPSAFRRTIFAYNYVAQTWNIVDPARSIGDTEQVLFDFAFADNVDNVSDYLGQNGDMRAFSLRIILARETEASWRHDVGLVELMVAHPADPNCVEE
jgi:hypothetical protein